LVGPTYDFSEYNDFINLTSEFSEIPDSTLPAGFYVICGFASMFVLLTFGGTY